MGEECRALFKADKGYRIVGVDASGLELRMLAHYMAKWDGGEYGKKVLEEDIHTVNQEAAGLSTRDQAMEQVTVRLVLLLAVKLRKVKP